MEALNTEPIRKLLVPLDGSLAAEQALPYAEALARRSGAGVILLRAVPEPRGVPDPIEAHLREVHEANEYLAEVASRLAAGEIQVETSVPLGDAVRWIAEEAQLRQADLIVMATHGRTGIGRWLYGSVAEGVLTRSTVPILMVRAWQMQPRWEALAHAPRILVPLDGSAFAEEALPVARRLADALGGELALVRAVYPPSATLAQEWMVASYLAEELETREQEAEAYLAEIARRLASEGRETEIYVKVGGPVGVIEAVASECEAALVVMATHGRTGASRLVLGSVAHAMLLRSQVPIVLTRPQHLRRD
ncbi:UspA domain protein [Thermobaculum terrenum ATCC BAA-798]|uniref:UspA domain protein n=1 Tax=Thermobaculum terrenum (strain ATCC BAA-798 / CCMEE 7001 / YNP1) TaxID=525904 RepID=D1CI65_THET1|nr:universal stress protein [Thermobaculum terrenum]ACZ43436.1 UspA domain protein [Thermobaculum terrenum ATCC BAA-798]